MVWRVPAAVVAAGFVLAASASATEPAPWKTAGNVRLALSDAQAALVLGDAVTARERIDAARTNVGITLGSHPVELRSALAALDAAEVGGERALAAARTGVWSTILRVSFSEAIRGAARGDVASARSWLLVREFRPPTRFSRAAADATVALDALADGSLAPRAAATAVRRDLLDTYDARLRTTLSELGDAQALGYATTRAELGALALGYWTILRPVYRSSHSATETTKLARSFEDIASASSVGRIPRAAMSDVERGLAAFRAAPLSESDLARRAGQLERFLQLVPIEYGRGVADGRVTLEFEIQEAVTFRDGAAAAFHDIEPTLMARDAVATRQLGAGLDELEVALARASRGESVTSPDDVGAATEQALATTKALYPESWKEASKAADFAVIAATLDRLRVASATGDWKQAESARLEAYSVFELGPEQRLRGLAPALFQEVEGYFWYGAEGHDGLVQLLGRRASEQEIAATRTALDDALLRSEQQIGSGPQSDVSVVTNSAIIVFREGLEAVLILAALMASLVGGQRHLRRPMLAGVGFALIASAVTWVVAQTVLTSLAAYGEKLEAIVSLIAIAVLLVILNWFYHRVYWQENLANLHKKKRRVLAGAGLSLVTAQVVGLVLLGFSSVYREGFETVLFLQAMTLEAGAVTVLEGVALGFAGVVAVFVLVIALERRLPHKKMLIATGVLITWVLVVMVGTTVQTMQRVGWIGVTPIEGLELPYWAGLWLGIFPTWQGVIAQTAAAVFVVGSYFAAETLRRRRRETRFVSASSEGLAAWAEPGSTAAHARLRDDGAASAAGLAVAAVDTELVLHPSPRAVRSGVVAEGRALAFDPHSQSSTNRSP
jgi:high-affinity iron transporter